MKKHVYDNPIAIIEMNGVFKSLTIKNGFGGHGGRENEVAKQQRLPEISIARNKKTSDHLASS